MQFGELITSLAGKAGIQQDNETLKKLLSFTEAAQFDVPDDFYKPLEQNLLTVESARANQDVRTPIFAEALNGVDTEVNNILGQLPFDDNVKNEIKSIQKNSYEKVRKVASGMSGIVANLNKQLSEAKAKPKDANSEAEIKSLNDQIAQLNSQIENIKTMHTGEVENLRSQNLNDRKSFALQTTLAGKPLPKNGVPQKINVLTANTLINQEMSKKGLHLIFDEFGNPILKQRKDGADIDYFVDNKKVDLDGFVDGVLAQNKFIQVNDPTPPNGGAGNNFPASPAPGIPTNLSIAEETNQYLNSLMQAQV